MELIFVLFSCLYLPYLTSTYTVVYGIRPQSSEANVYRLVFMVFYELASISLVLYVLVRRGQSLSRVGWSPRWNDLLHGGILLLISWIVSQSAWYFYYIGYRFWYGASPKLRDVTNLFSTKPMWLFVFFLLLNSFYEEGIVRAFATTELSELTGRMWLATIVSVLLQTGYHAYQGAANMFIVGTTFLVSGVYFAKTRRLLPIVISHTLMNLSALLLRHT